MIVPWSSSTPLGIQKLHDLFLSCQSSITIGGYLNSHCVVLYKQRSQALSRLISNMYCMAMEDRSKTEVSVLTTLTGNTYPYNTTIDDGKNRVG